MLVQFPSGTFTAKGVFLSFQCLPKLALIAIRVWVDSRKHKGYGPTFTSYRLRRLHWEVARMGLSILGGDALVFPTV